MCILKNGNAALAEENDFEMEKQEVRRKGSVTGRGSRDSLGTLRLKINAGRAFPLAASFSHTLVLSQFSKYSIL